MKRFRVIGLGTAAVAAILIAILGCSKSSNMMSSAGAAPKVLSVNPIDGATNVAASAKIALVFSVPMDTGSVRANFCLLGGDQMQRMMDSLSGMHSSMDYSRIMGMMHQMSMTGHLGWNANFDSCRFSPDSAMQANTQYMIFMGRNTACGMANQNQMMGKDWGSHFTTSP